MSNDLGNRFEILGVLFSTAPLLKLGFRRSRQLASYISTTEAYPVDSGESTCSDGARTLAESVSEGLSGRGKLRGVPRGAAMA